MGLFNRFEAGDLFGPVAAIGGALGGAAKAAGTIGGIANSIGQIGSAFGGGGASAGGGMASQIAMALAANLERQKISDGYFDGLIGAREIKRGPNKGEMRYGKTKELLMGQKPMDVFGLKPQYLPVDFETMWDQSSGLSSFGRDVTRGNRNNFADNAQLASAVNNFLTTDSKNRVGSFDPYLLGNIEQTGRNAALAAQGILPTSDSQDIVGARNELAGIFNTAGTSRGQVAKDLGLARLDLQTRVAPGMMQSNAALINAIAPPQMRDDPRSSQVQLGQALGIGAADNQFEATFDRQENNLRSMLAAMPDPRAQGLFNLQNTLRAQQFMIDFGLANGLGVPGTMPDSLGGDGFAGIMGNVSQGLGAASNLFSSFGSLMGGGSQGSMGSPGLFG